MSKQRFQVGQFVRFQGFTIGHSVFIHSASMGPNAVWLPSGNTCTVSIGTPLSDNATIIPEDQVPDEIWAALARWRLTQ